MTDPIAKKALVTYGNMRNRTRNPNVAKDKNYLGLSVDIDSRDFIGWFIAHYNSRSWKMASVGRIDHSRGYSLDNIEMQEMSENSKERIRRKGNPGIYRYKKL
jgi:hypothetical protein